MVSIRSTKAGAANPKECTPHDLPCWTCLCFCMFEELENKEETEAEQWRHDPGPWEESAM